MRFYYVVIWKKFKKLCRTSREANEICLNEHFWQAKYLSEFKTPNYPVTKWKKEYKMKYMVDHPKTIFKLVNGEDVILLLKAKNRREAYKYIAYLCNDDLIDQRYISKLVQQYDDPDFQIEESKELKAYCNEYYGHKFKYHRMQSTLKICKRFYLKPNYLYYYLENDSYSIKFYFNLFKYLYSKQFHVERFIDSYPNQIDRPYFTVAEIEMMLQPDSENSDGDMIELVEDEFYGYKKNETKKSIYIRIYRFKMESGFGPDMLYEVMLNADYNDMKALVRVNQQAYELSRSEQFWQEKFLKQFGKLDYDINDWKQEYKIRYKILNPCKLYRLECIECKPDKTVTNILNVSVKNKKEACRYIAHCCNNMLIDEHYVKLLAMQGWCFETVRKSFDINKLLTLCANYYSNNKAKIDCYDVGGDPITYLAEHCYLGYLNHKMLYYKPEWAIDDNSIIFDFYNYLYSQQFCQDRVKKPFIYPIEITRPNFTPDEIELMLNNKNGSINLIEDQCIM